MAQPSFIAVDWGSSSFRAWAVSTAGEVIAARSGPDGLKSVKDRDFEAVIRRHCGDWIGAERGPAGRRNRHPSGFDRDPASDQGHRVLHAGFVGAGRQLGRDTHDRRCRVQPDPIISRSGSSESESRRSRKRCGFSRRQPANRLQWCLGAGRATAVLRLGGSPPPVVVTAAPQRCRRT